MIKKALSIITSAAMVLTMSPLSAFAAEPVQTDDTFNYVALGDSIAAGYGLTEVESLTQDPALVLRTEKDGVVDEVASAEDGHNLIPVTTAYPYLFYQNTLIQKGAEAGMTVNFANLSSVAFRASDVYETILTTSTDPYDYAAEASYILDTFVSEGASNRLSNHPALYKKYLSDADLVSIQLGGNDMMMGAIGEMKELDNPILNVFITSLDLILFGYDADKAILYGISQLAQTDITIDDVIEAAEFLNSENLDDIAVRTEAEAVENVSDVIDAVDEVAPDDVQIALLNMYNPYGNSLEYGMDASDYAEVVNALIKASLAKVTSGFDFSLSSYDGTPQAVAEAESDLAVTTDEATDITADMQSEASTARESLSRLTEIGDLLGVSSDDLMSMSEPTVILTALMSGLDLPSAEEIAAEVESLKDDISEALSTIAKEIAYPIQYLLVGRTIDGNIQALNEDFEELAAENENVTLVDVYDIPNECNTDPHPDLAGHEAIAELMGIQLEDLLNLLMPEQSNDMAVYRLYNAQTSEHLWTTDAGEYATLARDYGWTQEGVAWSSPSTGVGVYRLYNAALGSHVYTTDSTEIAMLTSQYGWDLDNGGNPLFYSAQDAVTGIVDEDATPIYRLYNSSLSQHLLTNDVSEYAALPSYGWSQESIAFYAL